MQAPFYIGMLITPGERSYGWQTCEDRRDQWQEPSVVAYLIWRDEDGAPRMDATVVEVEG